MSEITPSRARRKTSLAASTVTRDALMDATEQLMREEGYAALTARKIAEKASIKSHQIIYYYFGTHEELLLAVFRRRADGTIKALDSALNSSNPLRSLWEYYSDPNGSWFAMEFMAVANHVESVRAEIARYGAEFRKLEIEAISRHFAGRGLHDTVSPAVLSLAMASLARVMGREATLGLTVGHDEVEAFMETYLRQFDAGRPNS